MARDLDPWAMFRVADMGDNLEEVVETEECKVLRMRDENGDGLMTIYRVFDGVYLMYNDFHMARCTSRFASAARMFCVDHCREGRIEQSTGQGKRYYIAAGDMRIDRRVHHSGRVDFSVSHYHGLTIGFFLDEAETAVRNAMPAIAVDISALAEKFCGSDGVYILRQNSSIEHIFSELYNVPARIRMDYFRIKVMELLVFLGALELSDYRDERPYFYSGQIEKIKAAHRLMTENLAVNYTAEALAREVDISVGMLKNGFKGVYGMPLYSYIRSHKMNVAASMLVTDRRKRIIEIAAGVGYDNPSKFAAAFKGVFGTTPARYRRDRR